MNYEMKRAFFEGVCAGVKQAVKVMHLVLEEDDALSEAEKVGAREALDDIESRLINDDRIALFGVSSLKPFEGGDEPLTLETMGKVYQLMKNERKKEDDD